MANKKMKKSVKKALSGLLAFFLILSFVSYIESDLNGLEQISVYGSSDVEMALKSAVNHDFLKADVEENTAVLKLFGVIPVKKVTVNKISTDSICLGGNAFGIKLFTKGVIVVGLTDIVTPSGAVCPASNAGIKKGDVILSVNGEKVDSAEKFGLKLAECGKNGTTLRVLRDEKEFDVKIIPVISAEDNNYKVGLWVRDSTAGIGTVTFIDKKTGVFGGLGHGVCDVDTGVLMPLDSGTVVDVEVTGVVKGEPQNPGELQGNFSRKTVGKLDINTETGVFGRLANTGNLGETVKIGLKNEVTEGKIYIYTTISGTTPQKYEAEIIKIYNESGKTKNFMIKVTDERLLEKTGGIVQGMSGSPILQNGKLIGAVTHVMINSPEKGYGIFIENMLSSANSILSEQNKAA